MKKSFLSLICMFIALCLYSQNNLEEVVYLKNGSIIRGIIIEQIPNESLKIQTKDGSVFVYKMSEIEKITKEQVYKQPQLNQNNTENQSMQTSNEAETKVVKKKDYLKKGFIGITEIGSLFAKRNYYNNNAGFSFNQVLGSRTSQTFSIGMAFGIDVNKYELYVPVTIDTRIYFIKRRITPFLNLAPGYALLCEKYTSYYTSSSYELYHSFITNFGLGAEFKITKGFGMSLNIGGRLTVIPAQNISAIGGSGFVKMGIVY